MIHLDFAAALRYNALGVLALVVLSVTFVSFAVNRVRDRRSRQWYELRYAPAATLALVVGWFVVRNLPFDSFSALRV